MAGPTSAMGRPATSQADTVFGIFQRSAAQYPDNEYLHIPASACASYAAGPLSYTYAATLAEVERLSREDRVVDWVSGACLLVRRAAAEAAKKLPFKFMLCARAENYLHGKQDLGDTILRMQAYQEAGADVLFAPGLARVWAQSEGALKLLQLPKIALVIGNSNYKI